MQYRYLKYFFAYLTPVVVAVSILSQGWGTFMAVLVLFGLLPLAELFTRGSTQNLSAAEEEMAKRDRVYDWLLYGLVPMQYGLVALFLYRITYTEYTSLEAAGIVLSLGLACGILGINAAHELGHRSTEYEQAMSKMLLLTSLYMHFFIEHNRGHHRHVSTDEDPASARFGENIYAFFPRTIYGSWVSAWKLEEKRLRKIAKPFWSLDNEMLRFQITQVLCLALIWIFFGWKSMLLFVASAVIGFLLLEAVNYIEHYGLLRRKVDGKYERVMPVHSWNSNHPMGRMVLLELSRHSDHHYMASRKYQVLRHFDDSPQMPTGYPGMILLALVPPLWFMVMHREIDRYRHSREGYALA
jgi:alkane 1-monooxygenase